MWKGGSEQQLLHHFQWQVQVPSGKFRVPSGKFWVPSSKLQVPRAPKKEPKGAKGSQDRVHKQSTPCANTNHSNGIQSVSNTHVTHDFCKKQLTFDWQIQNQSHRLRQLSDNTSCLISRLIQSSCPLHFWSKHRRKQVVPKTNTKLRIQHAIKISLKVKCKPKIMLENLDLRSA